MDKIFYLSFIIFLGFVANITYANDYDHLNTRYALLYLPSEYHEPSHRHMQNILFAWIENNPNLSYDNVKNWCEDFLFYLEKSIDFEPINHSMVHLSFIEKISATYKSEMSGSKNIFEVLRNNRQFLQKWEELFVLGYGIGYGLRDLALSLHSYARLLIEGGNEYYDYFVDRFLCASKDAEEALRMLQESPISLEEKLKKARLMFEDYSLIILSLARLDDPLSNVDLYEKRDLFYGEWMLGSWNIWTLLEKNFPDEIQRAQKLGIRCIGIILYAIAILHSSERISDQNPLKENLLSYFERIYPDAIMTTPAEHFSQEAFNTAARFAGYMGDKDFYNQLGEQFPDHARKFCATTKKDISKLQRQVTDFVIDICKKAGIQQEQIVIEKFFPGLGCVDIFIAILGFAIEADGPFHYLIYSKRLSPRDRFNERILQKYHGDKVKRIIRIPYWLDKEDQVSILEEAILGQIKENPKENKRMLIPGSELIEGGLASEESNYSPWEKIKIPNDGEFPPILTWGGIPLPLPGQNLDELAQWKSSNAAVGIRGERNWAKIVMGGIEGGLASKKSNSSPWKKITIPNDGELSPTMTWRGIPLPLPGQNLDELAQEESSNVAVDIGGKKNWAEMVMGCEEFIPQNLSSLSIPSSPPGLNPSPVKPKHGSNHQPKRSKHQPKPGFHQNFMQSPPFFSHPVQYHQTDGQQAERDYVFPPYLPCPKDEWLLYDGSIVPPYLSRPFIYAAASSMLPPEYYYGHPR